jgi:hypothetical protein
MDQVPPRRAAPRTRAVGACLGCLALCLGLILLDAPAAEAGRGRKHIPPDSRTTGLGGSCSARAPCKSKAQRCMKEMDANGKELAVGFCVLPCHAIDAGLTQVIPGQPIDATPENVKEAKKAPPPRCPPHYQCRSAGSGVPIDLCIKE